MRKRLIVAAAALAATGGGYAAATGIGSDSSVTAPEVGELRVELTERAAREPGLAAKARKPRIIYLQGQSAVNSADPNVGPYVDVKLSAPVCKGKGRVLGGGVVAANTDVFQQGSYVVPRKGEYHVLLGFDDAAASAPVAYDITSHLICAKGFK